MADVDAEDKGDCCSKCETCLEKYCCLCCDKSVACWNGLPKTAQMVCAAVCVVIAIALIVVGNILPGMYASMVDQNLIEGNVLLEATYKNNETALVERFESEKEYNMSLFNITNLEQVMKGTDAKLNLEEIYIPLKRKTHPFGFEWNTREGHKTIKYRTWTEDTYVNSADASKIMITPSVGYMYAVEAMGQSETVLSTGMAYTYTNTIQGYLVDPSSALSVGFKSYLYAMWFAQTRGIAMAVCASQSLTGCTGGTEAQVAALWSGSANDHQAKVQAKADAEADPTTKATLQAYADNLLDWEATGTPQADAEIMFGAAGCSTPGDITTCPASPVVNPAVAMQLAQAAGELGAGVTDGPMTVACRAMGFSDAGIGAIGVHIVKIAGLDSATNYGSPSTAYTPAPTLIPLVQAQITYTSANTFSETPTWTVSGLNSLQDLWEYQMATGEFVKYTFPGASAAAYNYTFTSLQLTARPVSMNDMYGFDGSAVIPNADGVSTWSFKMTKTQFDAFKEWIVGDALAPKSGLDSATLNGAFAALFGEIGTKALAMGAYLADTAVFTTWLTESDAGVLGIQAARNIGGTAEGSANNNAYYTYWAGAFDSTAAATAQALTGVTSGTVFDTTKASVLGNLFALQFAFDSGRAYISGGLVPTFSAADGSFTATTLDATGCVEFAPSSPNPMTDWVNLQRCVNYLQHMGLWNGLYSGLMQAGGTEPEPENAVLAGYGTFAGNIGPFVKQTVDEMLYGWSDPLLDAFGMSNLNPTSGLEGPKMTTVDDSKNANGGNGTKYVYEYYTGEPSDTSLSEEDSKNYNMEKAMTLYAYEQVTNLCHFNDTWVDLLTPNDCVPPLGSAHTDCRIWLECINIKGARETQFDWQQDVDSPPASISRYVSQGMRYATLGYVNTTVLKNITLWEFALSDGQLSYSADNAKYRMDPNGHDGFFDLQWQAEGAPIGLSQPYWGATSTSNALLSQVTYTASSHPKGFPYNESVHNTRILIDPLTGRAMSGDLMLQAAVMLKRSVLDSPLWDNMFNGLGITDATAYPNDRLYLPMYWGHEHQQISDEDAESYVKNLILAKKTMDLLRVALTFLGVLFLGGSVYLSKRVCCADKDLPCPNCIEECCPKPCCCCWTCGEWGQKVPCCFFCKGDRPCCPCCGAEGKNKIVPGDEIKEQKGDAQSGMSMPKAKPSSYEEKLQAVRKRTSVSQNA